MANQPKKSLLQSLLWVLEGIFVGFGAILPGVSGGTLCVAFGVYRPLIETLANWREGLRKYGVMLVLFVIGGGLGFVGLSGLAAWLLEENTVLVTCAFVGFIAGTFPQMWHEAGEKGRSKNDIASLMIFFVLMVGVLFLLKTKSTVTIAPGLVGYLFCGVLWGLSFIVPGLGSSSLLLFFGLYQPMLEGIAHLDFSVLIPMGVGVLTCLLLLSRGVNWAYQQKFSLISHAVLGIMIATAVMILPACTWTVSGVLAYAACLLGGAAASYGFTRLCDRLDAQNGGEAAR